MIIFNNDNENLLKQLIKFSNDYEKIVIAVAFFSGFSFLEKLKYKNIELIVSLTPPTNYYDLKKAKDLGLNIKFLNKNFHSKLYLFFEKERLEGSIIGSSNFSFNGLKNHIETNVFINQKSYLNEIRNHYENHILKPAKPLEISILEDYKIIYDLSRKANNKTFEEQIKFEAKHRLNNISQNEDEGHEITIDEIPFNGSKEKFLEIFNSFNFNYKFSHHKHNDTYLVYITLQNSAKRAIIHSGFFKDNILRIHFRKKFKMLGNEEITTKLIIDPFNRKDWSYYTVDNNNLEEAREIITKYLEFLEQKN
jgi:HKD family nuclease